MSARAMANHNTSKIEEISETTEAEAPIEDISSVDECNNGAPFGDNIVKNLPPHISNNLISRDVVVSMRGSPRDFAISPEKATWKVHPDASAIWQTKTRYEPGCKRSDERQGDLSKVILVKMAIKKVDSSFPCHLALTMSGTRGNVYSGNGDQFCYCAAPNEKNHNLDKVVLTTSNFVNSEYLRLYPGMTGDKLRTDKIMKAPGQNFTYIAQDHPVIEMINENAETLQVNLEDAELVDGMWYKVQNSVAERCLSELEQELVQNLPITNLADFSATIHRMDGVGWSSTDEICENVTHESAIDMAMEKTRRFTAVVNLTYAFM